MTRNFIDTDLAAVSIVDGTFIVICTCTQNNMKSDQQQGLILEGGWINGWQQEMVCHCMLLTHHAWLSVTATHPSGLAPEYSGLIDSVNPSHRQTRALRAHAYPARTLHNLQIYFCVNGYNFVISSGSRCDVSSKKELCTKEVRQGRYELLLSIFCYIYLTFLLFWFHRASDFSQRIASSQD